MGSHHPDRSRWWAICVFPALSGWFESRFATVLFSMWPRNYQITAQHASGMLFLKKRLLPGSLHTVVRVLGTLSGWLGTNVCPSQRHPRHHPDPSGWFGLIGPPIILACAEVCNIGLGTLSGLGSLLFQASGNRVWAIQVRCLFSASSRLGPNSSARYLQFFYINISNMDSLNVRAGRDTGGGSCDKSDGRKFVADMEELVSSLSKAKCNKIRTILSTEGLTGITWVYRNHNRNGKADKGELSKDSRCCGGSDKYEKDKSVSPDTETNKITKLFGQYETAESSSFMFSYVSVVLCRKTLEPPPPKQKKCICHQWNSGTTQIRVVQLVRFFFFSFRALPFRSSLLSISTSS